MTTSWAHFVRGEWLAAISRSVPGTMLAVISVAAVPWTIATALRGDWVGVRPTEKLVLGFCSVIVTVIVFDWLMRLGIEHFSGS